jgi:hypothetical protein
MVFSSSAAAMVSLYSFSSSSSSRLISEMIACESVRFMGVVGVGLFRCVGCVCAVGWLVGWLVELIVFSLSFPPSLP